MKKFILLLSMAFPVVAGAQNCINNGTGTDGVFHATSNMSLPGGVYNFTTFTIDPGVTVTVTGNNPLDVHCTGAILINGVLSASGGNGSNGVTYTSAGIGGIGVAGGANGGNGSFSSSMGPLDGTNGNGTGGTNNRGMAWSGGGGGGFAVSGSSSNSPSGGFGGPSYGTPDLSGMPAGSGGGGGSGGYDCGAGGGGAGGGVVAFQTTSSLTIGAAGMIACNGGNGGTDGTGNCGGGGGGSGGAILLRVNTLTNNGLISAVGGQGGASNIPGNPYYGVGGAGADGRIRIDYTTMTGTGIVQPASGYTATPLSANEGTVVPSCSATSEGDAAVIVVGGTGPYTYLWANGETTNPAVNLSAGTTTCDVTDADGCTVTVNFTIPAADNNFSQALTICANESLTVGTTVYTTSGNYTDVLTNAAGCDSTVTTNLTVRPAVTTNQSFAICSGESVAVGDSVYTTSGTYTNVLSDVNGCDSTITTQLTVHSISAGAAITNSELLASPAGQSYQWYDCANDIIIQGATATTYVPTQNGQYAVIVTNGNCADTSDCVAYDLVGLTSLTTGMAVAYPNPTTGKLTVQFNESVFVESLLLTDMTGRQVLSFEKQTITALDIDIANEQNGVYFLTIKADARLQTLKITKY